MSGVDIEDCVSDSETICGDVSTRASNISTEPPSSTTMPPLNAVSISGSESESDFDPEVGPSWGCKILPKNKSYGPASLSSMKSCQPICRRFYSTDCNVEQRTSLASDDDFERRSLPSNFVTSSGTNCIKHFWHICDGMTVI